ncbi:MAG: apolipoprotein N-acyltransferase [Hyphomicrobium sp.]|nr:apolipoprotein N-acyltransferase [Hyphomicrobium sp.]
MTTLRAVQDLPATFRAEVQTASGYRRVAWALGTGAASVLAMAPFFLWPVLFVTLPVWIWLATAPHPDREATSADWRAFRDGWWFGFGYFFAGLFWIGEAFFVEAEIFGWLMPFAVTLLPAVVAVYFGLASVLIRKLWHPGLPGVLTAAVIIALIEWLRAILLTGFPWNTLGYALTGGEILMQSAAIFGIFGLTLWTVLIFAGPLVLLAGGQKSQSPSDSLATAAAVSVLPLLTSALYGAVVLSESAPAADPPIDVRVVQPSVPQRDKWMGEKQREIFESHEALSRQNAKGEIDDLAGIELLVWPEAAMPFRPLDEPAALERIANLLPDGTHMAAGILRVETVRAGPSELSSRETAVGSSTPPPDAPALRRAFNSLAVFDADGRPVAIYDKIHLVPFGEYLPFQETLEALGLQSLTRQRGGFSSGPEPRPLIDVQGLPKFVGLICYEAIFPNEVVEGPERPALLVNVTNDGWFGNTTGPRQHLHQTRVRAVEQGLPVIRAGNNGISAAFDGRGRIVGKLDLNQRGSFDVRLPAALAPPPFAVWGQMIFLTNLLVFGIAALVLREKERRR